MTSKNLIMPRTCKHCGGDMSHKHRLAKFCCGKCQRGNKESKLISCLAAWRTDEATDEQLCKAFDDYMKGVENAA